MNLTTALRQSNNDAWIARKLNLEIGDVEQARADLTGKKRRVIAPAVIAPAPEPDEDDTPRSESYWNANAETASLALKEAVRLYLSNRAARLGLPELDWVAFDAREAERDQRT